MRRSKHDPPPPPEGPFIVQKQEYSMSAQSFCISVFIILVLQEDIPTVVTAAKPGMLYDYSNFPPEVSPTSIRLAIVNRMNGNS